MMAPAFKRGLTGFDSMIWSIKRYKKWIRWQTELFFKD